MVDILKKSVFATIGIALMTKNKMETFGNRICAETQRSETDGRVFVNELMKHVREAGTVLKKGAQGRIESVLKKINIPTSTDVASIEKRLNALESFSHSQQEPS